MSQACAYCSKEIPEGDFHRFGFFRPAIKKLAFNHKPNLTDDSMFCTSCLNQLRAEYVEDLLEAERGELGEAEREVIQSLKSQEFLSEDVYDELDARATFGERIADKVASFGGSWRFIILFAFLMASWILLNVFVLVSRPFDPFPFILLNLILSCLAAVQAPVIMMSQNRQEAKDRLRSQHDYQINLKAELEIRQLTAKLDQLINNQWQRLLEIQRVQTELIQDVARRK